jgi:menaquinone-dependent protoporphyrinogen IX oxidase
MLTIIIIIFFINLINRAAYSVNLMAQYNKQSASEQKTNKKFLQHQWSAPNFHALPH